MRYLDRLVLEELQKHRDPAVRKQATELLTLLSGGKTPEPFYREREVPIPPRPSC